MSPVKSLLKIVSKQVASSSCKKLHIFNISSLYPLTCLLLLQLAAPRQLFAGKLWRQLILCRSRPSRGHPWTPPTRGPAPTTPGTSSASTRSSRGTTGRSLNGTGYTGQVNWIRSPVRAEIINCVSGARMLYKNLPRNVGLRRLTLHKSATGPNVNYILLVECSHFLDNINQVDWQLI